MLPLMPVNQKKDEQGSAALTPHLCHIFTCSLCEHQLGAANAAGLQLSANLSQAQILPPFSSVWSPGFGSPSSPDPALRPHYRDFSSGMSLDCLGSAYLYTVYF